MPDTPEQTAMRLIKADEKMGAGNFDQAWADVYKYVYGPSSDPGDHSTWQQRRDTIAKDINEAGLVMPFTTDQEGNIEFAFTTKKQFPPDPTRAGFTFADGSQYQIAPGNDNVEVLTLTDNNGIETQYKWDGHNAYRQWDGTNFVQNGASATTETNGDLTLTYPSGRSQQVGDSITFAVNGDVVRSTSNSNGTEVTTKHANGLTLTVDTYKDGSTIKTISYPNRVSIEEHFDKDNKPFLLRLNGYVGNQQINNILHYDSQKRQWQDSSGNYVNDPVIDFANAGDAKIYAADQSWYDLNPQTLIFESHSPDNSLTAKAALGGPPNPSWPIDFSPPQAPTATATEAPTQAPVLPTG